MRDVSDGIRRAAPQRAETGEKLDLGGSTVLPVVETELEGSVTCPDPDCEEVFLVPDSRCLGFLIDGAVVGLGSPERIPLRLSRLENRRRPL